MAISFRQELQDWAKAMVTTDDHAALIKAMVRTLVNKLGLKHASVLLRHRDKNAYLLTASEGSLWSKLAGSLLHIDQEDPLVLSFFRPDLFTDRVVIYDEIKSSLKNPKLKNPSKDFLKQLLHQMEIFDTAAACPVHFKEELLGLLLLGKKKNGQPFKREDLNFFTALTANLALGLRNAQLSKIWESELEKKHQLFIRTTIALTAAIEAKDNYTHGHITRVTNLSLGLARKISERDDKEFSEDFLQALHIASLLHDIGKIGIPEQILNKRGDLTIGERNRIKEHPAIGVAILKPINELKDSISGIKFHHERWDGLGYPEGLKGNQIPLIASIITVADSFDAMINDRPYRPALELSKAVGEVKRLSGRQFNPEVSEALIILYQEGKV